MADRFPTVSIVEVCRVAAVRVLKMPPALTLRLSAVTELAVRLNILEPDTAVLAKSLKSVTCDFRIVNAASCCVTLL